MDPETYSRDTFFYKQIWTLPVGYWIKYWEVLWLWTWCSFFFLRKLFELDILEVILWDRYLYHRHICHNNFLQCIYFPTSIFRSVAILPNISEIVCCIQIFFSKARVIEIFLVRPTRSNIIMQLLVIFYVCYEYVVSRVMPVKFHVYTCLLPT